LPLLVHEPHRQRGIEQEREIELDQEIKSDLTSMSDRLGEPSPELGSS
jgi:hypothetical protein